MVATNVGSHWDADGNLVFRQGEPNNASGHALVNISGMSNGVHAQWGTTATAATGGLIGTNFNANYYLSVTDNTGKTYYIPIADATWA